MLHSQRSVDPTSLAVVTPLPDPRYRELYRQVYVGLDVPRETCPAVIGVTSAISGEGRTTLALGLAQTLAVDLDVPLTLVEADLERPALAAHFGLALAPGLCEVLRDECRLDEVLRAVSANLSVVTTGAVGPDAARLLRQLPVCNPFRRPHAPEGVVILDLPPIINHSYSALAAGVADALVLVVRAGVTPSNVVQEAIARLEDRPPQGVVFNAPRSSLPAWWPTPGTPGGLAQARRREGSDVQL
jgi:Mrp family chromosome partitioning ATPase